MMTRCYRANVPGYANYGGRGIAVCQRWHSSALFLLDMGQPPAGCSLDRINNDGNYEPSNCRWATRSMQARNTRFTIMLTVDGATKSLADWADERGVLAARIYERLKMGWSQREAIFRPVKFGQRRAYDHARMAHDQASATEFSERRK